MLQMECTTPKQAAGDDQARIVLVAVVIIPVETLVLYTDVTLQEEEMAAHIPFYPHPIPRLLTFMPFINNALVVILAFSIYLTRRLLEGPRRPPARLIWLSSRDDTLFRGEASLTRPPPPHKSCALIRRR